jgi:hypothetical protein
LLTSCVPVTFNEPFSLTGWVKAIEEIKMSTRAEKVFFIKQALTGSYYNLTHTFGRI